MQLSIKPNKVLALASILGLGLIAIGVYNVIVSADYIQLVYGFLSAGFIVAVVYSQSKKVKVFAR